jgi:ribonuclease BN (tRNA processing enzyme)
LRFRLAGADSSEASSRTIGVSGDTGWCDRLERLARGSDVLILECTSRRAEAEVHLSLDEIRRNAGRLAAERIVLVHLTDEVAEALAIDPIPRVSAAHDGMLLAID